MIDLVVNDHLVVLITYVKMKKKKVLVINAKHSVTLQYV